ncbi:ABC transporter permease [Moritella sp. 36]|uniref:ABC transporter permease n=1 Tax=Moritella sp. 36 TaxID=2746233 RepID=UPI001BA5B039|nr:ABC transporter permease [Moritella sp. 36]QUM87862.1 ABC transporter permease [Moritella sp. 36]
MSNYRNDFIMSLKEYQVWSRLGWTDILKKYRRSFIGPFWLTLSTAIYISSIGVIFSEIFNTPMQDYLPYLALGLIFWMFINQCVTEGAEAFINNAHYIKQMPIKLAIFPMQVIWRNFIVLAHNMVIFVFIAILFDINITWYSLWSIVGIIIFSVNVLFLTLSLSCFCARFRDLHQIVLSIMQIAFFATPIMWNKTALLGQRDYVLDYNPFFHFVELFREPLLGGHIALSTVSFVSIFTVFNMIVAAAVYKYSFKKISFWV